MTKSNYAKAIATMVNGEVKDVEKANGVIYTGIMVETGSNVRPCIYIDKMFDDGLTVEEAAEQVKRIADANKADDLKIDDLMKWENVKPMLRARLYNEKTSADVKKSAACYGFDDLVIIPYIDGIIENGSIKVTYQMLERWNVSAAEVLDIAEKNSNKEADAKTMLETMREMGYPIPEEAEDDGNMIVVTNKARMFGAYAVITKLSTLKVLFPNGFTVLPSSVHEVIVTPINDQEAFDDMVSTVNDEQVDYAEQLSNHAYRIAA